MEEDIQFTNMDTWKGVGDKQGLTFKQIILNHINRCVTNGSVEFHGGFWEQRAVSSSGGGSLERKYIPNSREVFSNSIRMLRVVLLGYYDDTIRENEKAIFETIKNETDKVKNNVEHYLKLFEELILLAKRLNFFQEETSEEIM